MARTFEREELLGAFDEIGRAAHANGTLLSISVYGGSALILASNFRFKTEDVDIAPLDEAPPWLAEIVAAIAARTGWSPDWFNDGVGFHLSKVADPVADHVLFGTFPRRGAEPGLKVFVPTASYQLALKLKAFRALDARKGEIEMNDIRKPLRVCDIKTPEEAIALMGRCFPVSAAAPEKQLFLLKHLGADEDRDAPRYPSRSD